ncbi:MAG: TonB-dependent receptor, partial [Xanthomonadaceae bacterium]|nr:TonB-dependent receptor [Xanthomonadaceae bacterium]
TANYDVTNKRAVGAAINIVTKSGTNDFHGSAYYAYTNANDLTGDGINGNTFTGYSQKWTAGGTLSGPIIKDTLFFFLDYEESKLVAPAPSFGPIGSNADNIVPVTQDQLNQIISIAKGYGLQPGGLTATGNNQDEKRGLVKLDWNINDSHRLSFRYNQTKGAQPRIQGNFTGSRPSLGLSSYWYTQERNLRQGVLNLYDDWTDNFSSEASISYAKYHSTPLTLANQPMLQVYVNKSDPSTQNASVYLGEDQFRHYNVLNVDTATAFWAGTWTYGDHSVKAGFDFQRDKFYNLFGRTEFGNYQFNSIAAFQAGQYSFYNLFYPAPGYTLSDITARWSLEQYGLFLQDTWQMTPNFSLQYGIRYDLPRTAGKPIYNPAVQAAFGVNNAHTLNSGVLEPRLSFNYNFDSDYKTQLRGGIGLSEGVTPGVWLSNPFSNNGITQTSATAFSGTFNPDPYTQQAPAGTPPAPQVDITAPNFKLPTVLKASLGFDRELPWWGLVLTVEDQYLNTVNGLLYQNINLGAPTGVLPDGRQSYWANPYYSYNAATNKATFASGPGANHNTHYYDVTYLTNTNQGEANYLALQLSKPFNDNWFGSVAFIAGHATEVNPGTSSIATSNINNNVVFNPNEDVASPSNYSFRRRVLTRLTWQHHFFGDFLSSVSATYDGHSGSRYSWVFGNDVNGICYGSSSNCPYGEVYIPKGPGDVEFVNGTSSAAQQQFFNYIASDPYLKNHMGQVAGRNGAHSSWVNQLNLSFRQEIPGIFKGNKGEIKFDIYNFTNLLNKKWGNVYDIDFPYARTLANFAGIDQATGKYVYSLPTSGGNYAPGSLKLEDQYAQSRWSVLVTLRYTF